MTVVILRNEVTKDLKLKTYEIKLQLAQRVSEV